MTRQLIFILTTILAACGQDSQTIDKSAANDKIIKADSLQTFSITNASSEDFNKAKKSFIDKRLYDTASYRAVNGVLKLPVDRKWKPFVIFTDTLLNTDDSDVRQFYYQGQYDNIGFYIVGGSFWEHSEFYLIDKRTGRKNILWSSPSMSPNDKFIANLSMPYGLEGVPNGIQVWRIDREDKNQAEPISISKHLELDQQIWAPDDFVWETDNSIILKVASVEKYLNENGQPNPNDFFYLRLKIK